MVQKEATDHKDGSRKINRLTVKIETTPQAAEACERALEKETCADMLRRSTVSIIRENNILTLKIEADDLTALRGSMNTYLRWADMCLTLTKED